METSDDIMELYNLYSAIFFESINTEILNGNNSYTFYVLIIVTHHYDLVDVPDIVAADLRIPSQVFASNPPPQYQVNDVSDKVIIAIPKTL